MTAFSRQVVEQSTGTAIWELRSVNHRYLEFSCRLPEDLRALEPTIRQYATARLSRGKVECSLRWIDNPAADRPWQLNQGLVRQLLAAADWIRDNGRRDGLINLMDIVRWPGVLTVDVAAIPINEQLLLEAFNQALGQLISRRHCEGSALLILLEQRLMALEKQLETIQQHMPAVVEWQRQKLQEKLRLFSVTLENDRWEQPLLTSLQRLDVTEEIERLTVHLQEIRAILQQSTAAVGRRLDFMLQELSREANTLAAKATLPVVTLAAVEMKLLIEQLREQIQNIE